jgi:hypothetical protein
LAVGGFMLWSTWPTAQRSALALSGSRHEQCRLLPDQGGSGAAGAVALVQALLDLRKKDS